MAPLSCEWACPTARRNRSKHKAQHSVLCYAPVLRSEALHVDSAPCAAQMRSVKTCCRVLPRGGISASRKRRAAFCATRRCFKMKLSAWTARHVQRSADRRALQCCHFLVSLLVSPTAQRNWRKQKAQHSVLCYARMRRGEPLHVDGAPCAAQR